MLIAWRQTHNKKRPHLIPTARRVDKGGTRWVSLPPPLNYSLPFLTFSPFPAHLLTFLLFPQLLIINGQYKKLTFFLMNVKKVYSVTWFKKPFSLSLSLSGLPKDASHSHLPSFIPLPETSSLVMFTLVENHYLILFLANQLPNPKLSFITTNSLLFLTFKVEKLQRQILALN